MILLPNINGKVKIYESYNSLVFRGRRKEDNKSIILKVLKEDYPTKAELIRYKQEYEITRSLNLEGVIKVYGQEDYQRTLVIILEDFGGESLQKLMQESVGKYSPIPMLEFLQIAIKITDALGNIHAANVIHKDINPGNIVLNPETGILKIIDFGIATQLPCSHSTLKSPNVLEGTLAYISPEQTGRMNRSLDYRTDFYSLGATFYEMLTNKLPFETTDAMELVHCHIAKQPTPPHKMNPEIPQVVSALVMKLLAKNAEERYQSAWGIKADLEECLVQLQDSGTIAEFPLARKDISDKFQIPQKLYGREAEVETLLTAFEHVVQRGEREKGKHPDVESKNIPPFSSQFLNDYPSVEMMLVSGYSGIGKSVLVQEVYKPIIKHRGYFISGKFDRFQRNTPYSGVVSAFSDLVQQLLTETESRLIQWREKILVVLGINAQVIIDIIPKVELIIGKQPPVPELSPTKSQNRFHIVFQHFISVFAKPEHPLVVFLDDLQWADAATLKLIKLLMTAPGSKYLFLIGSYRDNEVSAAHPLMLTIDEIQQSGGIVNNIFLSPLNLSSISELISDTLKCPSERTISLSKLVLSKTDGNPFFINEFLKSLYAQRLIEFDRKKLCWRWDLDRILFTNLTDNIVELMALKIQNLSATLQRTLQVAAVIGYQFDLQILASSCGKPQREIAINLHEAMVEGLVLPLGDAYKEVELNLPKVADELTIEYKFSHDRIQQAAYCLIPEKERQAIHWRVGQLLLQNTSQEMREAKIFDIVNQLNFGIELTTVTNLPIEWDVLASLNLMASKKAKTTVAYEQAFKYLKIAIELSREDSWETHYKLTLALYVELAEAAYLCGNFEQVEKLVRLVLQQAKTLLDQVTIYEVKLRACMHKRHTQETMETAFSVLKLLGINFPKKSSKLNTVLKLLDTKLALAGKRIEDLSNLPQMTDPYKLAAMRILDKLTSAVYFAAPSLYPLIVLKQVNLSIKYGNASESACAYVGYGVILCGVLGDIDSGYQFGQLALNLVKHINYQKYKTKILLVISTNIQHWKEHLRETVKFMYESYQSGLETGDLEYAYYSLNSYSFNSYFSGKELSVLEREMATHMDLLQQMKQGGSLLTNKLYQQVIWNLMNVAENPSCLINKFYNRGEPLPSFIEKNNKFYIYFLYLHQAYLSYLFGNYQEAVKNIGLAEKYLDGVMGLMAVPIFYFYNSLAHLAIYDSAQVSERKRIIKKIAINQKKMKKWAHCAPMNYRHKFYLIEAEKARVLGQILEAEEFYELAIKGAYDNEFIQEEALAYELAALFYLTRGREKTAQTYVKEAHYCYVRWGATAKVKDLEVRYPQLLTQSHIKDTCTTNPTTTTSNNLGEALDLATLMKANVAISGEIVLNNLLSTLMNILIENAGAQIGFLILEKAGEWVIEVSQEVDSNTSRKVKATRVLQSIPIDKHLPTSIISYVIRTHEIIVLNDATCEGNFINEPYIKERGTKSILCTPLLNQGNLVGIVYLENNLAVGAFTQNRIEVLQLLSRQAAIAITNAKLYAERQQAEKLLADSNQILEQQVTERTLELSQEKELLQAIIDYIPVMITLYDANGRVKFVNRELEQFLGWSSTELEEIDLLAECCINLEQREQVLEHMIAATGKWLDFKVKTKDNRYVDTSWANIQLSNGMRVGIGQDISDRKLAEEASILEERNRMARDIHDTLAQDFAIIALHLNNALRKITIDVETAQSSIQAAREQTRSGLTEARRSVSALRSPLLESGSLYSALNRLATQMFSQTNTHIFCEVVGEAYVLPKEVENNLFRIAQEALNNAFKYALASEIRVKLVYESGQCILCIEDNGRGFEVGHQPVGSGFGLPGMIERAEYIGAQLTVWSAPGQGTEIMVMVNQR